MKVRRILFLLIPFLIYQCNTRETTGQLVVEASISAGKPVENVSVKLMDEKGLMEAEPVSNADVRLLSFGVTYLLNEIKGRPGYYAYYGSDLEIISGHEYMIWVQHESSVAVTSIVIKANELIKGEAEDGLGYSYVQN